MTQQGADAQIERARIAARMARISFTHIVNDEKHPDPAVQHIRATANGGYTVAMLEHASDLINSEGPHWDEIVAMVDTSRILHGISQFLRCNDDIQGMNGYDSICDGLGIPR